jgi:hypothetical protein
MAGFSLRVNSNLMKRINFAALRILTIQFIVAAFLVSACSDDEEVPSQTVNVTMDESSEESISDELDDLAAIAMNSEVEASGGRTRTINDDRINCSGTTVTFTNVAIDKTSGTVTIQFGPDGCTDSRGNVRKGMVTINWSGGKWFRPNSMHSITLTGYSINGIGIEGTRAAVVSSVTGTLSDFTIVWFVIADNDFTWPDGTTSTRQVGKERAWHHTLSEDTFTISNAQGNDAAVSGTNRRGISYSVSIQTPLVYKATCVRTSKVFLPVSGVKVFSNLETQRTVTVDFGSGDCDSKFTVTSEGRSKTVTASNTGS